MSARPLASADAGRAALDVGLQAAAALALTSLIQRFWLGARLWPGPAGAGTLGLLQPLQSGWIDALAAVGLGVALGGLARASRAAGDRVGARVGDAAATLFVALALAAIGTLRRAHIELVAAQRVGLDLQGLRDVLESGEAATAMGSASAAVWFAATLPAWIFVGLGLLAWRIAWARAAVAGLAFVCLLLPAWFGGAPDPIARDADVAPEDARWPGELWLARSWWRGEPGLADGVAPQPSDSGEPSAPELSVDLPSPASPTAAAALASAAVVPEWMPPKQAVHAWNVVWIVMESTGSRYVEGTSFPGRRPMPTLDRLAAEGWRLAAHRSPSNSSATSIQAQMTGLYPMPQRKMFSIREDNHLPALPALLPRHDRFLVTPGKLDYFFPRALLQHSGLADLVGFHELPFDDRRADDGLAKDELRTVDAFLARLGRAREPFFGVYYSYVPHWEYTDYGPEFRRYRGHRLIDRYHNGLVTLDAQIARIFESLRQQGRLERTVIVLAGDHGEAFGQHDRNWAHSKHSYEENLQTPAVLWQPRLFRPRRIAWPTCHIDLLPTVLDAIGVPFEPRLVQGESLWRAQQGRELTLHWGNEGTVTVLRHADLRKLQVAVDGGACRSFDLRADPGERHPRGCGAEVAALRQAARDFIRDQRALLPALSAARAAGLPYLGLRHPTDAAIPSP